MIVAVVSSSAFLTCYLIYHYYTGERSTHFSAGGATFATADTSLWGALGGVQGGFNWQSGAFAAGVEGDFDWSNLKNLKLREFRSAAAGDRGVRSLDS